MKSKTELEAKGNGIDERGFNIFPAGICNEKFNFLYYGLEKIKSGILIIIKLLFNNFASINWFIIFIYLNKIYTVFKIP